MPPKAHPLEAAFDEAVKIRLPEGGAPKKLQRDEIPVSWAPGDGLCLGDIMGGNTTIELPVPPSGTMPPLRYTHSPHGSLFLGQRWTPRPSPRGTSSATSASTGRPSA